jgi:RHS repeat-associated protein
VRSTTNEYGSLEDRYEYDAFGKPYQGDLTSGMSLGYTGKPYDTATGLYNYGYRDYQPETARFTTVDPVRDGANWFAYVNNDPVNWVDLWGLTASDKGGLLNSAKNLAKEILSTIKSWAGKPSGEPLTKGEAVVQKVAGGILMGAGFASMFSKTVATITNGKSVNYGLAAMSAGAMVFADGINGVKSNPLEKITNAVNPVTHTDDKIFVSPF